MTRQARLADLPVDEEEARRLALLEVREKLGMVPTPGSPRKQDATWVVPILVRFPRAVYHEALERPERMRFMDFGEVGTVEVDIQSGEILRRTHFYEVQRRIQDKLSMIRNTVEMALAKSGAGKFARLAFAEHMHSPVVDLISWIMLNGELSIEVIERLAGAEAPKYLGYAELLKGVGLLAFKGGVISPSSFFIEIETSNKPFNDRLTDALAFYFARGYEEINSVRQFVGPQLAVSGLVYEAALEAGSPVPVQYSLIESSLVETYGDQKKILQLPRYIAQLEGVDLLTRTQIGTEWAWRSSETAFGAFVEEKQILGPVLTLI